jgi:hypothetical protein
MSSGERRGDEARGAGSQKMCTLLGGARIEEGGNAHGRGAALPVVSTMLYPSRSPLTYHTSSTLDETTCIRLIPCPPDVYLSPNILTPFTIPGHPHFKPTRSDISGDNEIRFHRQIQRWGVLAGIVSIAYPVDVRQEVDRNLKTRINQRMKAVVARRQVAQRQMPLHFKSNSQPVNVPISVANVWNMPSQVGDLTENGAMQLTALDIYVNGSRDDGPALYLTEEEKKKRSRKLPIEKRQRSGDVKEKFDPLDCLSTWLQRLHRDRVGGSPQDGLSKPANFEVSPEDFLVKDKEGRIPLQVILDECYGSLDRPLMHPRTYATDNEGTLYPFDPSIPFYQPHLVGDLISRYPRRDGINTSYAYVSSYGTCFAWHDEDVSDA